MSFNSLHTEIKCPFCHESVSSGIGFRYGVLDKSVYKVGDRIRWDGKPTRPKTRPGVPVVKTVGYFNCDNIRCSSWQDCFPMVQRALITFEGDRIADVAVFDGEASNDGFDIIEPLGLS